MKNNEILEDIIKKVCQRMNIQLYDWQLKGRHNNQSLVVYITRKNGVTLDDCQKISQEIGDELDMRDIFESRYVLEVSSPGLNRNLKTPQHFIDALNELVKIKFLNDEQNIQIVKGVLKSANEDSISIKLDEEKNITIFYEQIKNAKAVFNWSSEFSKKNRKN
ncbi:MAG: ribosome maturation factor RimP [Candidatus Cloacimonetes bacterium]|nr:ribosome maturation factor RimP [Candidatus Cloacimonadota bacterium]